jgi:hypothetical protein
MEKVCQACGLKVPVEFTKNVGSLEVCVLCHQDAHESISKLQDIALEEAINKIIRERS